MSDTTTTTATAPPALLTMPEAARRLSIGERKIQQLISSGALPAVRIGRAVRIDPVDLAAYIGKAKRGGGT